MLIALEAGLAIVFGIAALAKFARLRAFREGLSGFGIPERFAPAVAIAVPAAEGAGAVLVSIAATGWWAALGLLVLLVVFSAVVGAALVRGSRVVCNCFGSLSADSPAGAWTLARNAVLAAAATVVVAAGPHVTPKGAFFWVAHLSWSERGLVGAVALLALAIAALLVRLAALVREQADLAGDVSVLRSGDPATPPWAGNGLPLGRPAPAVALTDAAGAPISADAINEAARPVVLLFTARHCEACAELAADLARWRTAIDGRAVLATVNHGEQPSEIPADYAAVDPGGRIARSFISHGTPSAVLVSPEWLIASGLAAGSGPVRQLLTMVAENAGSAAARDAATGDQTGRPLPALRLTARNGEPAELTVSAERTLLFLDPMCPHSGSLLPELRALESAQGADLRLVTIARKRHDGREIDGLRSLAYTDPDGKAFRAASVRGTPAALLTDEEGIVLVHARGLTQVRHLLGLSEESPAR